MELGFALACQSNCFFFCTILLSLDVLIDSHHVVISLNPWYYSHDIPQISPAMLGARWLVSTY